VQALEIGDEVHRGPDYVVRRARWSPDHVPVVLKEVRSDGRDVASASARLAAEYDLLAPLALPGVVRVLAFSDGGEGRTALVMQDAGPRTLAQWLTRRPLAPEPFLAVALQLAETLNHLHRHGILHRDVTPANVVVSDDGRLTLVDFDGAIRLGGRKGIPGRLETALPYIAPEETGRVSRLVDHRADLYSLGATFYELLTGAPPFPAEDPVELLHAHLARAPVRPDRSAVPPVLSDIVLRLLAKMPEARYQSAEALRADLLEAQARWRASGAIAPFELGLVDLARELPLPEKLLQREAAQAALLDGWGRAVAGERVVMLLTGGGGVGKTALAATLRESILGRGGYSLIGKADAHRAGMPLVPVAEALRGLAERLRDEPEPAAGTLRLRLLEALGPNAAIITELCPELEAFLGPAPPLPTLDPAETEGRFQLVVRAFLGALATAERPLAIFLDDLQWADPASLRLFERLANAPELHHLLLLAATRSEVSEVPAAEVIALGPLDEEGVTALCSAALRCPPQRARPLAALLFRKTGGNPFFLRGLLRFLHREGILAFDSTRGSWAWDLSRVETVALTDNVVELLVRSLRRLSTDVQETMRVAACIGDTVPVSLLAAVRGLSWDRAMSALWTAADEGLLEPVTDGPTDGRFRFAHDRVREAAHALLDGEARKALHLRVARQLLASTTGRELDERLFPLVEQLGLGADLITEPEERLRAAQLHLRAGRKAQAAAAFSAGLHYVERGLTLAPPGDAQLAFALHREAMTCAFVSGDRAGAEAHLHEAVRLADSRLEKALLYEGAAAGCIVQRDPARAVEWICEGLRLFGIEVPEDGALEEATRTEGAAVEANLRGRTPAELLEAPVMRDPELLVCAQLLWRAVMAVAWAQPRRFAYLSARAMNFSLEHGNGVRSPNAYLSYASEVVRRTGDIATGHAFGRMALELARRFGDPVEECRALTIVATSFEPWCGPLEASVALAREARRRCLEAGELLFAVAGAVTTVVLLFHQGVELNRVMAEIADGIALARRTGFLTELDVLLAYEKVVRRLQGTERERGCIEAVGADGSETPPCDHQTIRLAAAYLLGDVVEASALATPGTGLVEDHTRRAVSLVEHNFYSLLTWVAAAGERPAEAGALLARIALRQRQLEGWAQLSPSSYRHKQLLVQAEVARVEGRALEAAERYEEAIEAAARGSFLHDLALANELAGRFHRGQGRRRFARLYLAAAVDGYRRWGARAKAELLLAELPELAADASARAAHGVHEEAASLELASLFRAAETIAGEVVLSELLGKLMEVCLASAGAERGALVIEEEGSLVVRAVGAVAAGTSLRREPLGRSHEVSAALVQAVRDSGEVLVLADASHHPRFAADPHVAAGPVRSVLALPLARQARLVGVLYLENNLATRAFTPERVRVLQLLSGQIATSLENSRLFEALTREVDERKRAEAGLRLLAEAGQALAESLDYRETLAKVARQAVTAVADWCTIDVLEEGVLRRVAAAHRDPQKQPLLDELRRWQEIAGPPRTLEVLDRGEPIVFADVSEAELTRFVSGPEARRCVLALGCRSSLLLPLRVGARAIGVMTLVSSTPERRYGPAEVALASELARRAGLAIDHARLYREAREAIRLRDEFLSVASHELNTPITSLKLTLEGFADSVSMGAQLDVARSLALMSRQAQRLGALVAELLDVARIQNGQLAVRLGDMDLAALVRETADRLAADAARAGCTLAVEGEPTLVGSWDRGRLEQVVSNLLSNAIKFGARKPIEIRVGRAGEHARLIVRDHGIGIPPERLPHIFGRFERAVPATHYGGLGLGLYVVSEIVRALGGTVTVESEVGDGATFTVELPLRGSGAATTAP
jgi:predicted ATPase/signal transduction histidine kinase